MDSVLNWISSTEFPESLIFLHFLCICFSESRMQKGHQNHNVTMSNTWRNVYNVYFSIENKHNFSWGQPTTEASWDKFSIFLV